MKRFDIHAWFGHWQFWDLYHKGPDDLVMLMDRHGIERAAVMSLRGLVDCRGGNRETLEVAAEYRGRLLPVATAAPTHWHNGDVLHRAIDAGAVGVRLYPLSHNYTLRYDFVDEVCAVATERGVYVSIPIRVMSSWRFQALDVDAVAAVVERHPDTRFLVSGVNYTIEFDRLLRLMWRCGNAWCEISCCQGYRAIRKLIDEVGEDRVLFGTGAVLHYPACNVAKLDHAEITEEQRSAIAWSNAHRLLDLQT